MRPVAGARHGGVSRLRRARYSQKNKSWALCQLQRVKYILCSARQPAQHHNAARQVQAAGARARAQASLDHDTVCLMRIDDLSHARDGGVMQVAPSTDYYSHGFDNIIKYPVTGSGELEIATVT